MTKRTRLETDKTPYAHQHNLTLIIKYLNTNHTQGQNLKKNPHKMNKIGLRKLGRKYTSTGL